MLLVLLFTSLSVQAQDADVLCEDTCSHVHGIDLSHYQGNVFWETVGDKTPMAYVYLKATEGGDRIDETFERNIFEELDEETMLTIRHFFENDLNISETARQLFIHRNTLVYRLEKLQKTTGLDIRKFDEAMTFKIAMMVYDYVNHMRTRE
jgi:hypothetical protein